jgi:hypothetical protein
MAYVTQEEKRTIAPVVKKILKKYGQKGTLSIRHHSSLVLKLKDVAGMFTFKDDFDRKWGLDVNPYHYQNHYNDSPEVVQMLHELFAALKGENYFNHDDPMTDYFCRKHYVDIKVVADK